ncbi:MAG TPA: dTDP-glucose 4,6-dehydratase [Gemmatimonadota bacterium]|nr:dTDP-glucose 4,6-dehydratase [Gemmatimonadota bacterium]
MAEPAAWTRRILVTGGAGFIGTNLVRHWVRQHPDHLVVNLDRLTYAGHREGVHEFETLPNYRFVRGDICNAELVEMLFDQYEIDGVLHLAAESHVDRSIVAPLEFVRTNVLGTATLLDVARSRWAGRQDVRFHHVSTDEVFGELGAEGAFQETTPYSPNSPYSASKAGSDHLVRAYHRTFALPVVITNCSNNYGPYQFPEKLIPLMITNAVEGNALPVYGNGSNVRDWLYVEDHCRAIDLVFHWGVSGETYNIGGDSERSNLDVVSLLCDILDEIAPHPYAGSHRSRIQFVSDRPGHDWRYAMDTTKIADQLGWAPYESFETGLWKTVEWYLQNGDWLRAVRGQEFESWVEVNYHAR